MERTSAPITGVLGTTLGAIGTVGAVAWGAKQVFGNGNNGNCNQNRCGNGCGGCGGANAGYVNYAPAGYGYAAPYIASTFTSALEAEVAQLKAERTANDVGIATFEKTLEAMDKRYDRLGGFIEKINTELVDNRVAAARNEERIACMEKSFNMQLESLGKDLNYKIDMTANNLGHAVEVESERRATADNAIRDWTSCNFVQYKRVIDASQICPPVQLANGTPSNSVPVYAVPGATTTFVQTGTPTVQAA